MSNSGVGKQASWCLPLDTQSDWAGQDQAGQHALLTEILAQVSREALQGDGLDAVLQCIVDCLATRLPVAVVSIILLDQQGQYFVQEVLAGELHIATPSPMPWPVTIGAAGRCARSGKAQLIRDIDCDVDYIAGNPAVRAEYLVPIQHRDRLHGVLNIESTREDFFTAEACTVFDAVANQIAGAVNLARVVSELETANRKLEQLSMSDGLTGIANRRCFDQHIDLEWNRLAGEGRMLAMLLLDVDCFKLLNDACGHLCGDECLRELARLCADHAQGSEDFVARFGGEELILLFPDRSQDEAVKIAERLRRSVEALEMPHPSSPVSPYMTISIGVCTMSPVATGSPRQIIAAADRALYAAKAQGRNRVVAISAEQAADQAGASAA